MWADIRAKRGASLGFIGQRADSIAAQLVVPGAAMMLGYATLAQGAFYWPQASFFLAGLFVVAIAGNVDLSGQAPLIAGLGGLAAGLGASVVANGWTPAARIPFALILIAGCSALLARAVTRSGRRIEYLEVVSWVGAIAAVLGLLAVAIHLFPFATRAQGIWRLATTLTYVNAAASLLILTLPAALLLLHERPGAAGPSLATFLIMTALVATLSRAGAVAAIVFIAGIAALGARSVFRSTIRPALATIVAVAGLVPSILSSEGQPLPALAGLGLGFFISGGGRGRRLGGRFGPTIVVAAILFAPLILSGQSYDRVVTARVDPGSEDRLRTWANTWEMAVRTPVFGTGVGTFRLREEVDDHIEEVSYAHNEYLQAFAETGAVGTAALLASLAFLALSAWRRRPARDPERVVWAVAIAACAAFAIHGVFDFVWHVPLLVALAFGWFGLAVTRPPAQEER